MTKKTTNKANNSGSTTPETIIEESAVSGENKVVKTTKEGIEVSEDLIEVLSTCPNIEKVYFDKDGNYNFHNNKNVEYVSILTREEILK